MCRARVDHAAGFKIATGEPQIKLSLIDGALSPHPAAPLAVPVCCLSPSPCSTFSKSGVERKQHIARLRAPHTVASVISLVLVHDPSPGSGSGLMCKSN